MNEAKGADRRILLDYVAMGRDQRDGALVAEIRQLMDHYGSIEFAQAYGQGIADAAFAAFEEAFAESQPSKDLAFIRALIPYMLGRRI
jgi:geranylgeranyl diphosphate synthase type II